MLVLKRKNVLVFSLVLLLIVTGYINYRYNEQLDDDVWVQPGESNEEATVDEKIQVIDRTVDLTDHDMAKGENDDIIDTAVTASASAFFIEYRLERDRTRSTAVEELKKIVNNPDTDDETRKDAQNRIINIIDRIEKEMVIENLIKSLGFKDAVSIIHEDTVSVIVNQSNLTVAQVAQIQSIVVDKAHCSIDNIKIIERG